MKRKENAAYMGSKVVITNDPVEACKDADIIYTDVWASMDRKRSSGKKSTLHRLPGKQSTRFKRKDDYLFMHCLPHTAKKK
ncbi:hypothetical protein MASR2M39_05010 [Ignavibacteriales bacterium]